jgi:hypothetical protein
VICWRARGEFEEFNFFPSTAWLNADEGARIRDKTGGLLRAIPESNSAVADIGGSFVV